MNIIYEDKEIIIINKDKGILSQNDGSESNSLENEVALYLGNNHAKLINRLDKDTSGLILFGKTEKAIRYFNDVFSNHEKVKKTYLTLVSGIVDNPGEVNAPIRKNFQQHKMVIAPEKSGGKPARTLYNPINIYGDSTLLEVELKTGRTHQIRVHMSYIRHHVIGDYKYGDFKINNVFKNRYGLETQFLHSYKLVFQDLDKPFEYLNGKEFIAELPDLLKNILKEKTN